MILHTGGRALGATSTRSSPCSSAVCKASCVGMTPSWEPSSVTTRTSRTRICLFLRALVVCIAHSSLFERLQGIGRYQFNDFLRGHRPQILPIFQPNADKTFFDLFFANDQHIWNLGHL